MPSTRDLIARITNSHWSDVVLPFMLSRLMIVVSGLLAISFGAMRPDMWHISTRPWLDMWARWDSGFYLDIATQGYSYSAGELSNLAFFPLYPFLLRVLGLGAGNKEWLAAVGVLVSNLATLIAFVLLYRLVLLDRGRDVCRKTIWLLAFFPSSFFLSVVYTEGLFLMLTVAALYAARRGSWLVAGVMGALSAVTRTIGVFLVAPLLVEWWQHKPRRWQTLALLALVPLGLALYLLFLTIRFGDPMIFVDAQAGWGRSTSLAGGVARFQELLSSAVGPERIARSAIDFLFVALGGLVLLAMTRKLRLSYIIYAAYCFLIPLATLQVLSMPRLLIVIFPIFIALAIYLRQVWFYRATLVAFGLLQMFLVARWSLWYWVA